MLLLDEHKESMVDGAYEALSNGVKAEQERLIETVFEVTYVQLNSHVDRDNARDAIVRGKVCKIFAFEADENEIPSFADYLSSPNRISGYYTLREREAWAKSAEWLYEGKVHHTWRVASLTGPILLYDGKMGNGNLVAIVTSIIPSRKRIRE